MLKKLVFYNLFPRLKNKIKWQSFKSEKVDQTYKYFYISAKEGWLEGVTDCWLGGKEKESGEW